MGEKRAVMKVKWLMLAALVPVCLAGPILGTTKKPAPASVTFSRDVAPIFYRHCVECHRPDNIAPMSLLSYRDARPFAHSIGEEVSARAMPPWHADPSFGEFANERRLSREEVNKILAWVEQGAVEGDPKDLPPAPTFPARWEIGQPDVVFTMAEDYTLRAGTVDQYMYFRIPTNFKEDRWVQAVEFRPGNRKVVHHAVAFVETPENFAEARRLDPTEKPGNAAWTLLDTQPSPLEIMDGTSRRIRPDAQVVNDGCGAPDVDAVGFSSNNSVLSVYAPGRGADEWAAGTAKKIPAGSNIILQMHYSKDGGKSERDRTSVALIFARPPVERLVGTRSISNILFEIPPRADNHKVTACWNVQRDIQLIGFMPHMHVRGKSMRYEVVYPDGRRRTLLYVPRYSFHWQTAYTLKRALDIPGGSRLVVTAYFDNSEGNAHNPDPSKAVRHGTATFDEMMIGFVDYIVPRPRERSVAKVDPRVYDAYVGQYELDPTAILTIVRVGGKLYAESAGQRVELYPMSETVFFSKNTESELSFVKNERGEVTGFVVTQNDRLVRVKRIGKPAPGVVVR
jgi:hypothetical protein